MGIDPGVVDARKREGWHWLDRFGDGSWEPVLVCTDGNSQIVFTMFVDRRCKPIRHEEPFPFSEAAAEAVWGAYIEQPTNEGKQA